MPFSDMHGVIAGWLQYLGDRILFARQSFLYKGYIGLFVRRVLAQRRQAKFDLVIIRDARNHSGH